MLALFTKLSITSPFMAGSVRIVSVSFPAFPELKKAEGIVEIRNAMNARCIIIPHIFPGPFRVDHLLVEQAGIGNNTAIYLLLYRPFNRCYPFFKKILISCFSPNRVLGRLLRGYTRFPFRVLSFSIRPSISSRVSKRKSGPYISKKWL